MRSLTWSFSPGVYSRELLLELPANEALKFLHIRYEEVTSGEAELADRIIESIRFDPDATQDEASGS